MAIQYPEKVQGGNFYLGDNLEMTTKTVIDSDDETITKTFKVLDMIPELPEVTSEDNGDVLTVVSGKWAKATPSGGSDILQSFATTAINETAQVKLIAQDGLYISTTNIWDNYEGFVGFMDSGIDVTATIDENVYHFTLTLDDIFTSDGGWGINKGAVSTEGQYLTCGIIIEIDNGVETGNAWLNFGEIADVGTIFPEGGSVTVSIPSFNLTVPSDDFKSAFDFLMAVYNN